MRLIRSSEPRELPACRQIIIHQRGPQWNPYPASRESPYSGTKRNPCVTKRGSCGFLTAPLSVNVSYPRRADSATKRSVRAEVSADERDLRSGGAGDVQPTPADPRSGPSQDENARFDFLHGNWLDVPVTRMGSIICAARTHQPVRMSIWAADHFESSNPDSLQSESLAQYLAVETLLARRRTGCR